MTDQDTTPHEEWRLEEKKKPAPTATPPEIKRPKWMEEIREQLREKPLVYGMPPSYTFPSGRVLEFTSQPQFYIQGRQRIEEAFAPEPSHMKNWPKLTPLEQDFFTRLPAIADHPIAQKLEWFGSTKLGGGIFEALSWMEEETEKLAGTVYQAAHDPSIFSDFIEGRLGGDPAAQARFSAAWNAGSMFYETIAPQEAGLYGEVGRAIAMMWSPSTYEEAIKDIPLVLKRTFGIISEDEYRVLAQETTKQWNKLIGTTEMQQMRAEEFKRWTRAFIHGEDMETGGLPALIAAREAILRGADPEVVKQAFLGDLGALAGRSQMFDAISLAVFDPLNFILPRLRPVERIMGLRNAVRTGRVAPEIIDSLNDVRGMVDTLSDATRVAESGEDVVTWADRLVRVADDLEIDDVSRAAKAAQKLAKAGAPADEIAKALAPIDDILTKADDMKNMSFFERTIYALSGGDPLNPSRYAKAVDRLPRPLRWVLKAPTLTPAARATEFVNTMSNSVRLLLSGLDDPVGMIGLIKKAAAGAFGGKFGHMILSPIGRHLQAVLKGWSSKGDDLLKVWQQTERYRDTLHTVARLTGEGVPDTLVQIQKGAKEAGAILDRLGDTLRVAAGTDVAAANMLDAITQGRFGMQQLLEVGEIFKSTPGKVIPFDLATFRTALIEDIVETAAQVGINQFGVTEGRWFTKAAEAVRSAESLVLLGLNPIYPIQNFFNNEITMIARGTWGLFSPGEIAAIWDDFGIMPARLKAGYTIGGQQIAGLAQANATGTNLIREALMGRGGFANKIINTFKGFASKDFRAVAGHIESMASQRAFTTSMLKSWRQIWVPGNGYVHMDDLIPGLSETLRRFDDELADVIVDAVKGAKKPGDIDAIRVLDDLRLNPETLLRRTARKFGLDPNRIPNILSEEITEKVRQTLAALGPRPAREAIESSFREISELVTTHIDDALERSIPIQMQEVAARIQTTGIRGVADVYSQISDAVYARQLGHARKLEQRISDIILIQDDILRNRAWTALLSETGAAWNRTWQFARNGHRGVVEGLKAAGLTLPDEYMAAFKIIETESKTFIKTRNNLWNKFFKNLPSWDDAQRAEEAAKIYNQIDNSYVNLMDIYDTNYAQMDDLILGLAGQGDDETVMAVREANTILRDMRRADMQDVLEFRQSVRGLSAEAKAPLWRRHWQERLVRQQQQMIVQQLRSAALSGQEEAMQFFGAQAGARSGQLGVLAPLSQARNPRQAIEAFADALNDRIRVNIKPTKEFRDGVMAQTRWGQLREDPSRLIIDINEELLQSGDMGLVRETILEEFVHAWQIEEGSLEDVGEFLGIALPSDRIRAAELLVANRDAVEDMAHAIRRYYLQPAKLRLDDPLLYARVRDLVRNHDELEFLGRTLQGIAPTKATGDGKVFLSDFDRLIGQQLYVGAGLDELWFEKGSELLNEMERQAVGMLDEPSLRMADLPEEVQGQVSRYLDHVTGQLNDARHASVRNAEAMRDSALLNYTRQYHFDAYLGIVAPYEFWWTHSVMRWMLHSIDRPAMLATFAKMKEFLMNVQGGYREGFPARLRGKVRIDLPWAPPEMGETWVDPFRSFGLPFESFMMPFERASQFTQTIEKRAERQLESLLKADDITEVEYEQALTSKSGPIWERAVSLARADDANLHFDLLDFMSLSTSPHLPISIAWNLLRGTPEEIGALPPERMLKNALGLMQTRGLQSVASKLGIKPGTYNTVWGNIRHSLGLPAFDQWEDYREDRELSNMAGELLITGDDAVRAMIEREGVEYDEAVRRVGQFHGVRAVYQMLGIPFQPYPVGEEHQRNLYDEFGAAMEADDRGDPTVLRQFFDQHPEFEARLALWKKPDERLRTFYVDQIWDKYHDMPNLHRQELRDHLGDLFVNTFLDSDTRSYESIPLEVMQVWLKIMGGDPPGQATYTETLTPLDFTDPNIAARMQVFYETRNTMFQYNDVVWPLQKDYFQLEEGAPRRAFRQEHPILPQYWSWRRDFMYRNPDLAPYIEDDPDRRPKYPSEEALRRISAAQPAFTPYEWQHYLGPSLFGLLMDYRMGEPLPDVAQELLDRLGVDVETAIAQIAGQ